MADAYNINIETKAQPDEIHKLLEELRAISAEMSVINGQTFSAVSSSAMQLSETTKALGRLNSELRASWGGRLLFSEQTLNRVGMLVRLSKEIQNGIIDEGENTYNQHKNKYEL